MTFTPNDQKPVNFDSESLEDITGGMQPDEFLEQREKELWLQMGIKPHAVKAQISMLKHKIEKRQVQRACITAKSQRREKSKHGISYELNIYDNLTTIKTRYDCLERKTSTPTENPQDHLFKFSARSRRRFMNKGRRLNKSKLNLPYFVTLTYHKNMQQPEVAKKHLNTFLQRWRRKSEDFAYFWKMEPQQRGAVHFHLAMFIPEDVKKKLQVTKKRQLKSNGKDVNALNALRIEIQETWAEVTKDVDGVDVPYSTFDYIRTRDKKAEKYYAEGSERQINTYCANPKLQYKIVPDIEHQLYGTNVREVNNWTMFLGYMYKYMEKEVRKNPFGVPSYKGTLKEEHPGYTRPPSRRPVYDLGIIRKKTGRFWGFSYNLDFEAIKTTMLKFEDEEKVNEFVNTINTIAFAQLTERLTNRAQRKKKQLKNRPHKLKKALKKCRNTYKKQKKRYLFQRDKLLEGFSMQFEIHNSLTLKAERFINSIEPLDFFGFNE